MLPLPPPCGRPCVRRLPDDPITFHSNEYFVPGGIRTCLEVSSDPMLVYFFEFLSTEFAAGRSKPAEVIIVKRLIQGRNNVTRVRIQPKYAISVVVKTTPLPCRPRCRLLTTLIFYNFKSQLLFP